MGGHAELRDSSVAGAGREMRQANSSAELTSAERVQYGSYQFDREWLTRSRKAVLSMLLSFSVVGTVDPVSQRGRGVMMGATGTPARR